MPQVISLQENDQLMPATWRVLSVFLRRTALTQADLRKHTGLSHPVIVQQVRQLRHAGLINLGTPISGQPGRPCTPLGFNWDFRRVLAVDVHPAGITLQAMNLQCESRGAARLAPLSAWSRERIRATLEREIKRALETTGAPWAGIGIVLPAIISKDGAGVSFFPGLPAWENDALGAELSARFDLPVALESDANALAYSLEPQSLFNAETILTATFRHAHFIRVAVSLEGHFPQGDSNCTGGIGHIAVAGNDRPCRCGRTGCLETLYLAAQEEPSLRRRFLEALAGVLVGMVSVLNPARVVIQGDAQWNDDEMEIIRAVILRASSPCAVKKMNLEARPSGATEALFGVANKLCRRLLDLRDGQLTQWAQQQPSAN